MPVGTRSVLRKSARILTLTGSGELPIPPPDSGESTVHRGRDVMSRTALFGAIVVVVAGLSGCATPAKIIHQDANSVVVAVPDNTNSWPFHYTDEAKCVAAEVLQDPDPVRVRSDRVKVGATQLNTQNTTRRDLGGSENKPPIGEVTSTRSSTSVSDNYEWHLVFQKHDANQVPNFSRPVVRPASTPKVPGDPVMKPAAYSAPPLAPTPAGDVQMPEVHMPLNPPPTPATSLPSTLIPSPGQGR